MSEEPTTLGRALDHPDTCETCRFYYPEGGVRIDDEVGECRRYAPSPITHICSDADGSVEYTEDWPLVLEMQWCGEHQPAGFEGIPSFADINATPTELRIVEFLARAKGLILHSEENPPELVDWAPGMRVVPRREGSPAVPGYVEFVNTEGRGVGVRWDDHAERGWGQDELDWFTIKGANDLLQEAPK